MDLPCPDWLKHVELKWTRLCAEKKLWFSSLVEIDEIFDFGQSQINHEDLEVLSNISEEYPVQKNPQSAGLCREQGNGSFKARNYPAAALQYSKGVCHASQSTEHLALCYANRSAALFHLCKYKECLQDITRALDQGYPSHLQHKLLDRQTQCLNHLKQQEQGPGACSTAKMPTTKLQRSQGQVGTNAVPWGVSPGLSLCFSPEKGRHLVSTVGRAAGEVVLEDRVFSCVLIPGEGHCAAPREAKLSAFGTEDRHCHHCLRQTVSPVPCAGCSYARYCGERCQRNAWQEHHRWECPVGSELLAVGVLAHLALRVALRAGLKEVKRARENPIDPKNAVPGLTGESVSSDEKESRDVSGEESSRSQDGSALELGSGEKPASGNSSSIPGSDLSGHNHGDLYSAIHNLLPHVTEHAPSLRFLCAVTMATLYLKLQQAGPPLALWEGRSCVSDKERDQWWGQEKECGDWPPELSVLGATALRHMLQLRCNAQAVSSIRVADENGMAVRSSQEIRLATAVFPTLSLLNHSCRPNTSIAFTAGFGAEPLSVAMAAGWDGAEALPEAPLTGSSVTVTVRASRDVVPGQELLHCYGPHCSRMAVAERRRLLQEQYFFLCQCHACQLELASGTQAQGSTAATGLKCAKCESPLQSNVDGYLCLRSSCGHQISSTDLEHRLQSIQGHQSKALKLLERDKPDEALKILQMTVTQADCFLTATHPLQGELADTVARVYATMGHWRQAASQLSCSVTAIRTQYGEDSVELGQQLFKLAQLHFNGGDPQPALSVIPSARRILSLHCSPHCEELQELQAMEDCLQGLL